MWDYVICKLIGEGLAKSLFKESPEDAAKRIAEEKRLLEEKKRKERKALLKGLPILAIFLLVIGFILYMIYQANK